MSSEVLTIRVSSELKSKLEKLGKTLHRSKSYIAEQAISHYVDKNAWQIDELTQAQDKIRQGNFVSNDEVGRYLQSWGNEKELKARKA